MDSDSRRWTASAAGWMPRPGREGPRSDLRAGDADRERVATLLGEHYSAGRLSAEELSERLERAYHARTLGDLAALTQDLPDLVPPRPPMPTPAVTPRRPAAPLYGLRVLVLLVVFVALALLSNGHVWFLWFLWPLFVWGRLWGRRGRYGWQQPGCGRSRHRHGCGPSGGPPPRDDTRYL